MAIKAIQQFMLGTILNRETQARATLAALKDAGFEGIELCAFMIHPTGIMVRLMTKAAGMPTGKGGKLNWPALVKESGLQVVSLHVDLGSLERNPDAVVQECQSYGTDTVVITGMYRFAYGDAAAVKDLAERLNKSGARLAENGVKLLYHNHNCELLRVDENIRAWDILIDGTDPAACNFEFDSYWYTEGGGDAKAMMRRLGNRMKLWHINDRGTRLAGPSITPILKTDSIELGAGNMDLEGLAVIAKENGVSSVVLESHRNWIENSALKSAQVSAHWLNTHF